MAAPDGFVRLPPDSTGKALATKQVAVAGAPGGNAGAQAFVLCRSDGSIFESLDVDTGLAQPLTDAQLRATPVPVSGGAVGLTNTELRASAVPTADAAVLAAVDGVETALATLLTELALKVDTTDLATLATASKQDAAKGVLDNLLTELNQKVEAGDLTGLASEATLSALSGKLGVPSADDVLALLREIRDGIDTEVATVTDLELSADQINLNTDAVETKLDTVAARIGTTGSAGTLAALLDTIRQQLPSALVSGRLPVQIGGDGVGLATETKLEAVRALLAGTIAVSTGLTQPLTDGQLAARLPLSVEQATSVDVSGSSVALDAGTLAALETINAVISDGGGSITVDDGGTSLTVDGTVALDAPTLAALETINAIVSGTVALDAPSLAALETIELGSTTLAALETITVGGTVELGTTTLAALESITVVDGGGSLTVDGTITADDGALKADNSPATDVINALDDSATFSVPQGYRSFIFQFELGTIANGSVISFEGTLDNGTNWFSIGAFSVNGLQLLPAVSVSGTNVNLTASKWWGGSCETLDKVRARLSTFTSGDTITVRCRFGRESTTLRTDRGIAVNGQANTGAAVAGAPVMVGGSDGTLARALRLDTLGEVMLGGTQAFTSTGDAGTKTTSFAGAAVTNRYGIGAAITVVLGTVSGTTPTLGCQLEWSPDDGTTWLTLGAALANLTTSTTFGLIYVYPGVTGVTSPTATGASNAAAVLSLNAALPRTWRIRYLIGGTTPSFAITAVRVNYLR